MIEKEAWHSLRWLNFRSGKSQREIASDLGISRNTVSKYSKDPTPPQYTMKKPRSQPVRDQWRESVREILVLDKSAPRKQRHTGKRIFDRLVEEQGYKGSLRSITQLVKDLREELSEPNSQINIPLLFAPGKDAQVDFGESFAELDGKVVKLYSFEMRLNYSRNKFQKFYLSPNREAVLDGHVCAFTFFNGVPERISYDNMTTAVKKVLKGKLRECTDAFTSLKGFFAFQANFCKPGEEGAHEKGGVESNIGHSRRNWLVPMPKFKTLDELNEYVLKKCVDNQKRKVAGQAKSIGEMFADEKANLLPLPVRSFESCIKHSVLMDNYGTVKLDTNRYSVPASCRRHRLWLKAFANEVEISDGEKIIARHKRSYEREQYILNPFHYLDLLEIRPHSLPYARPLLQADWPPGYWNFYQRLLDRHGSSRAGKDFVQVLRLHYQYGAASVRSAIEEAMNLDCPNADVIQSIINKNTRVYPTFPHLSMDSHEHLAAYCVVLPEPEQYSNLLEVRQHA